jgi:hypothetical protein
MTKRKRKKEIPSYSDSVNSNIAVHGSDLGGSSTAKPHTYPLFRGITCIDDIQADVLTKM